MQILVKQLLVEGFSQRIALEIVKDVLSGANLMDITCHNVYIGHFYFQFQLFCDVRSEY